MTLYDELQVDVSELLSDEEIKTGIVRIVRTTISIPGENPWDPSVDVTQVIDLDAVVFSLDRRTGVSEFIPSTLVVNRLCEITASGLATVVEEGDTAVNYQIDLEVQDSDVLLVDGDVRQIIRSMRTPEAGSTAVSWTLWVAD